MTEQGFWHRVHGHRTHNVILLLLEDYVVVRGGKIKDGSVFKKCVPPCEPDLYCEYKDPENGKTYLRVFEIESDPTKESVLRKQAQYQEMRAGILLTVLDVNAFWKFSEGKADWNLLRKWFEQEVPI